MGLRPGIHSTSCLTGTYIGSEYDNIKKVSDNIDGVILVADNMSFIKSNVINFVQENIPIGENLALGSRWFKPSTNQTFAYYFSETNPVGIWTETTNGY